MSMRAGLRHGGRLAVLLALAGCSGEPEGQVAATIDGSEVTQREVQAELDAESPGAALAADADARAAALERVIDRKLLARMARSALIDRSPQYQAAVLRQREELLADMIVQRSSDTVPAPTDAEVAAQVGSQPWRYGQRTMLVVERLGRSGAGATLSIDSAALTPEMARRLLTAPLGAPITVVEAGQTATVVVRQRQPLPMARKDQLRQAAADLHRARAEAAEARLMAALRARARIVRQPLRDAGR